MRGEGFDHVVFEPLTRGTGPVLHVYIEGDGSPRQASRTIPPDPTPRKSVLLPLMAMDPRPRLLLGRPCHHGITPCNAESWTLGRYGDEVVESMTSALRRLSSQRGEQGIVLIGFSGGGALAMLMAERLPEVRAVVTLAGNLAVESWAQQHGYVPLEASLDPATRPPLDPAILQIHLRGARDRRVPPELTQPVIDRQHGARGRVYAEFDHRCCWQDVWPSILAELDEVSE